MSMLLLMAALLGGSLTPPMPIGEADWISTHDYPPAALRGNMQGAIVYEVLISPQGKPVDCTITMSSGQPILDAVVCPNVMRRSPYTPAQDQDGKPISARAENVVNFSIPGSSYRPKSLSADVVVSLNAIPKDLSTKPDVDVAMVVGENGAIERCEPQPSPAATVLGKVACQQAEANWAGHPVTDRAGKPVRALVVFKVGFTADHASTPHN